MRPLRVIGRSAATSGFPPHMFVLLGEYGLLYVAYVVSHSLHFPLQHFNVYYPVAVSYTHLTLPTNREV